MSKNGLRFFLEYKDFHQIFLEKICLECIECHITMDFYFRLRFKSLSPLDPDPPAVLAQNLKFVCLSFLLI